MSTGNSYTKRHCLKGVYIFTKDPFLLQKVNSTTQINSAPFSHFCLFLQQPRIYVFSCASSVYFFVYSSNRIHCKQRASHRSAKVCDILECLKFYMKNCTDCMQRAFLQNVAACDCWDYQPGCMSRCTGHNWNASPLSVLTCAVWGYHFLCKNMYTGCNETVFPLSEWTCAA